jgi:hypothetical protein
MDLTERHPGTQAALRRLIPNANLPNELAHEISSRIYELGLWMADELPDNPDLVDGLRKLWEAKNCAVYLAVMSND